MVKVTSAIIEWVTHNITSANKEVLDTLYKWQSGEKEPTFNQIETVSKQTHIPLGYFFLETPPKEEFPIFNCRTIQSKNINACSRNTKDTINHMSNIQEWMRNYLINAGYTKLSFVGSTHTNQDVQTITKKLCTILQITPKWHKEIMPKTNAFKFFREKIEAAGILVMTNGVVGSNNYRRLDVEEFRAFTLNDKYAPLIFINTNDSSGAKLFSLIHETVHVLFGVDNFNNNDRYSMNGISTVETICNAVATEVLLPQELFVSEWHNLDCSLSDKIQALSTDFKCGRMVVVRRAFDNKFIDKKQYQDLIDEIIKQFYIAQNKRNSGGNYYNTLLTRISQRFLISLDNSIREGKTLYTEAYRLTNTNRETFSNAIETVRSVNL
jgi:Zn-dependent peptidase ImmA (M78 family)